MKGRHRNSDENKDKTLLLTRRDKMTITLEGKKNDNTGGDSGKEGWYRS